MDRYSGWEDLDDGDSDHPEPADRDQDDFVSQEEWDLEEDLDAATDDNGDVPEFEELDFTTDEQYRGDPEND